jgi:ATP-grasp ribosomal peptide maturase
VPPAAPSVLVIAQPHDTTADLVIEALDSRGADVVRFDTAAFPMSAQLAARPADHDRPGWLTIQGKRVDLGGVRSVYRRRPARFSFPEGMSGPERRFADAESMLGLGGVLAAQPWRWIDSPSVVADASYKPRQLQVAAACGLRVPRSLITNDPEQVRAFAAEVGPGGLVYKALHAAPVAEENDVKLVYTSRMTEADLDRLDDGGLRVCPHLVQEWIDKAFDVRLTVVGEHCFPVAVHARTEQARVDWRSGYDDLTYRRCDLPADVRSGALAYLRRFGLTFGAFDFSVDASGRFWFLECNPAAEWGWLVDETDAPIADAIADELLATA